MPNRKTPPAESSTSSTGAIPRRELIAGGCAALLAGAAAGGCKERRETKETTERGDPPDPAQWWEQGRYVDHRAVSTSLVDKGIIRARVDGQWRDFKIGRLPDRFVRWSLGRRIAGLEKLAKVGFDPNDLDGPHNACVATYGGWPRDSAVSLNTAYKGIGLIPKEAHLPKTLEDIAAASKALGHEPQGDFMATMGEKTRFLERLYQDADRFDRTKMVSMELFATPTFATHTFLNMMANPIASFSFLAFPTFEVRAVPQLLHPENPGLTDYQRNAVAYANAIHNFAHGGRSAHMTCLYHVLEVYNDSPGEPGGLGRRIS